MLDATEHPERREKKGRVMSGLPRGAIYFVCCILFLVALSLLWLVWVCNMISTVRGKPS